MNQARRQFISSLALAVPAARIGMIGQDQPALPLPAHLASYYVGSVHHVTALNYMLAKLERGERSEPTVVQLANATTGAQSFHAVWQADDPQHRTQAAVTQALAHGKPPFNPTAFGNMWNELHYHEGLSARFGQSAWVANFHRVYSQATEQDASDLAQENGLRDAILSLHNAATENVAQFERMSYHARLKGHVESVEQFNCAAMSAGLAIAASVVGIINPLAGRLVAIQFALAAWLCSVMNCANCDGVEFDPNCCTA